MSLVIANSYAMTHNPAVYHDHDIFNPDQYLSKEDGGRGEPYATEHFVFAHR